MREYVTPVTIRVSLKIHTSPTCTPTPISPITVTVQINPQQTYYAYVAGNVPLPDGISFPFFGVVD